MSTSYIILRFKGTVESLLQLPSLDQLPSLGSHDSVRKGVEAVLPNTEWHEEQGEIRGNTAVDGAYFEFSIPRHEIVRSFGITARGRANRSRLIAALCRRNGWQALDLSESRFIEPDRIQYLNTDLDLESREDLTILAQALEAAGLLKLHAGTEENGSSVGTFEAGVVVDEPELHIAAMLSVVEKLSPPERAAWDGCMRREFNIGYDCGSEPPVFSRRLPAPLVDRIAAAGASLVITLYPPDAPTRSLTRE